MFNIFKLLQIATADKDGGHHPEYERLYYEFQNYDEADHVSAKEFILNHKIYKKNRADEVLEAWKLKDDVSHKTLKFSNENIEGSLILECPSGFSQCPPSLSHEHACCAMESRSLFYVCPDKAKFFDDKCWVHAKKQHRCPVGYDLKDGNCYKGASVSPSILCPTGFERLTNNSLICTRIETIVDERCIEPAYHFEGKCVMEERSAPSCPTGYDLDIDGITCRREYTAPCDMKVPLSKEVVHNNKFGEKAHASHSGHLRRLADHSYSYHGDKADHSYSYHGDKEMKMSIDKSKDHSKYYHYDYQGVVPFTQYEENMVDPFTITKSLSLDDKAQKLYKKADELMAKSQKELTHTKEGMSYDEYAKLLELKIKKFEEIEKKYAKLDKVHDKEVKDKYEKEVHDEYIKDMELAKKAILALDKDKDHKDKNHTIKKMVKATCIYEDVRESETEIRLVEVSERDIRTKDHTIQAEASVICPPTFLFDRKDGICKFYAEEKASEHCDGIFVEKQCMEEVIPNSYCEKPWVQSGDQCVRQIFAPGLYTWVRDFQCFGNSKYCGALYQYDDKQKH